MDYTILASNLLNLRLEKKWSQSDLAGFLNLSRQAVSKWETGQSVPDIDSLLLLSKLFSYSINDLLEKPIGYGITSIEDVMRIDSETIQIALLEVEPLDLYKAAKGVSPTVQEYLAALPGLSDLKEKASGLPPVKLSEVEIIHKALVNRINDALRLKRD